MPTYIVWCYKHSLACISRHLLCQVWRERLDLNFLQKKELPFAWGFLITRPSFSSTALSKIVDITTKDIESISLSFARIDNFSSGLSTSSNNCWFLSLLSYHVSKCIKFIQPLIHSHVTPLGITNREDIKAFPQ